MQVQMWDGQQRVVSQHPYMSTWPGWPLMLRPIWYAFEKDGEQFIRGVLMLGNPLIMWGGLAALGACVWAWFVQRSRDAFLIVFFFAAFYFCWALIPRKIAFFYYYYPAGMTLSMAIAFVFHYWETGKKAVWSRYYLLRWTYFAACLGIFIYFFPILAALRIPSESFRQWMWLRSWI
jgi:dolichyl-phosphate-mannose--protein O-mannosyl transferase